MSRREKPQTGKCERQYVAAPLTQRETLKQGHCHNWLGKNSCSRVDSCTFKRDGARKGDGEGTNDGKRGRERPESPGFRKGSPRAKGQRREGKVHQASWIVSFASVTRKAHVLEEGIRFIHFKKEHCEEGANMCIELCRKHQSR